LATEAVVLAAGSGTRFGGRKLLAPWGDGVLLDGALAAAFAAPVRAVTVVTGADAEAVGRAARAFSPAVKLAHAADHAEGMAASLRAGLASLPADTKAVLVLLGDMPRPPHAVLASLVAAVEAGAPAAAPRFGGRRGNPVALSAALFPQLMALSGDAGARRILDGLGERLALIDAPDDGVLYDVDQPGDLPTG
jgi:molybdenum cofactor cytidylyltransferase